MKKFFSFIFLLSFIFAMQAQNTHEFEILKSYSQYDSNLDGSLEVDDVTTVADQVKTSTTADATPQIVKSSELQTLLINISNRLTAIDEKIDGLERRLGYVLRNNGIIDTLEVFNGHDFVDMGVKDSLGHTQYWAVSNVGSDAPDVYGDYFAWGETVTKDSYDWSNYKYGATINGRVRALKYNTTDMIYRLELADDPANQVMGGHWRTPTDRDWKELLKVCDLTYLTSSPFQPVVTNGWMLTSKITKKYIVLKENEYMDGSESVPNNTGLGFFWCSTWTKSGYPYYLFWEDGISGTPQIKYQTSVKGRAYGMEIRACCTVEQ